MDETLKMSFPVYPDVERGRYRAVWKFPSSVQAYTGEAFTYKWRKGIVPTRQMVLEQIARYHARIYETSPVETFIAGMGQLGENTRREKHRRMAAKADLSLKLVEISDQLREIQGQIEFRHDADVMQAKYGVTVPAPVHALAHVSYAEIVREWADAREQAGRCSDERRGQ